jgi:hypothetical protein
MDRRYTILSLLKPEHQKVTDGKNKKAITTAFTLNISCIEILYTKSHETKKTKEAINTVLAQKLLNVIIEKIDNTFAAFHASVSRHIHPGGYPVCELK